MKKNYLALILALTMAAACVCTACGSSDKSTSSTEEDTSETTVEETTDDSTADASSADVDYEKDIYGTILNNYYQIISVTAASAKDDSTDTSSIEELMSMPGATGLQECVYSNPDTALDCLGYAIQDMSGDGIPELVIGYTQESDDSDCMIFSLYTCNEGDPVNVIDSWYRNKYFTKEDNMFGYYGASSAASSGFGLCHLSEDGMSLVWDDFYFSDYGEDGETIVYYHNTTGEWDAAGSEVLDMSDKDFWNQDELIEAERVQLDLTPFSAFTPAN